MKLRTPSRAATTLVVGMFLLVATTIFAQQFSTPRLEEETTTKLVADMITRYHVSHKSINNEISEKLLARYLKVLDPQKLYFTKSDVDMLSRYRHELDDLLKVGNVDFAYKTYELYRKRVVRQMKLAHKLIDADHDFTLDDSILISAEKMSWAASAEELNERWRKQVKFEILALKLQDTPLKKIRERLHRRYQAIEHAKIKDTDNTDILEMYLSSLTHCFDPHSSYMSPRTLEDFRIQMNLKLEGIGAALRSEDGMTIVARIVPGGAADKDGHLKVNDKIIAVRQAGGEWVDVVEMKLGKVVRYIRGPKKTVVILKVVKGDSGKTEEISLTRQTIELKSSQVRGEIIKTGDRVKGTSARIGVVNIPSFYRDFAGAQAGQKDFTSTIRDLRRVLRGFADKGGVDAVIVDLRTNGGGALSEAIAVSGAFIDRGPIVQVKQQNGKIKSDDDYNAGVDFDGPLVVVCNRLSASASEIFAGAIQDYKRGIVVGDTTTHGKGTVQNVMPVGPQLFRFLNKKDRGALKLTIAQFYRVDGDSTQVRGVRSDIVIPSLIDHMDLGESFLDNALKFDHVDPVDYDVVGMVTPTVLSRLRKQSQARIAKDPKFQKQIKTIAKYVERKKRKTISLNEKVRRTELDADKSDKDKKDKKKKKDSPSVDGPIFPVGSYNDELLHIAIDYATLLKGLGRNTARR